MATPPAPPKKVFVSGCFDLIHSGHVEFFNEAAKFGQLYVRLGTDANILALKGHHTMYNDAERLFMVQNLKSVHDVAMSIGTGRYDYIEDMKVVRPDIYICGDDAGGGLEKRRAICAELGVECVVLPRKPQDGLVQRSSTAMKARLRDIVAQEGRAADAARQAEGAAAFNEAIPWRLCFAGGWMDLKWCNELHPGCVITLNIQFHPGICKDQCGLATSSRRHWMRLWNGKRPDHLEAGEAAKYLYGAENFGHFGKYVGTMPEWEKQSYSAGSQDHCGLLFPGITRLNYTGAHWPSSVINLHDRGDPAQAAVFEWLEGVLWVVEIPFVSRPPNFNSQRVNHLTDESIPREQRVAMVKVLADASDLAWQGIVEMDIDKLGKGLSGTMKGWAGALPYTVDPYLGDDDAKTAQLRAFWERYDAPHTKGCLFSGAGGGFLFVIDDKPVEGGMQVKLNTEHIVKPFASDKLDSAAHPVPFT